MQIIERIISATIKNTITLSKSSIDDSSDSDRQGAVCRLQNKFIYALWV